MCRQPVRHYVQPHNWGKTISHRKLKCHFHHFFFKFQVNANNLTGSGKRQKNNQSKNKIAKDIATPPPNADTHFSTDGRAAGGGWGEKTEDNTEVEILLKPCFTQGFDSSDVRCVYCGRCWTLAGGGSSLCCGSFCGVAALRLSLLSLYLCCGCFLVSCFSPLRCFYASCPCFDSGLTSWPSSRPCACPCPLCVFCRPILPCSSCPWTSLSPRPCLCGAPSPSSCSCHRRRLSLCLYGRSFCPGCRCGFFGALFALGSCLRCGTASFPCPLGPYPDPCLPSLSSDDHVPSPAHGQSWARGVLSRDGGSGSLTAWVTSEDSAFVWVSCQEIVKLNDVYLQFDP